MDRHNHRTGTLAVQSFETPTTRKGERMSSSTNNRPMTRNWRSGSPAVSSPSSNEQNRHISVPRVIPHQPDEGRGAQTPYGLFEDRVRTGPFGLNRFPFQPHSPSRILVLDDETVNPHLQQFIRESPPRIRGQWLIGSAPEQEEPGLTEEEFKKAMSKLRKQIFNPNYPRKRAWKVGLFSRHGANNNKDDDDDDEDEGKKCTICLEAFVANEQVLVTPCNHMFHSDCIVPWVKSHGQCPVCRLVLGEKRRVNALYMNNRNGADELILLIRAMEEAFNYMNFLR